MDQTNNQTDMERRRDERYNVALDIEWSADSDLKQGRLNDISSSGCYVLAAGEFTDGEVVRIYFPTSDGKRTEFVGEIINNEKDIGFAVRFVNLTEVQTQFIQNFAELHHHDLDRPTG